MPYNKKNSTVCCLLRTIDIPLYHIFSLIHFDFKISEYVQTIYYYSSIVVL